MWKFLALVILGCIPLVSRATSYYTAPKFEPLPERVVLAAPPLTEKDLLAMAEAAAARHGVSRDTARRITHCEAPIVERDGVRYYDAEDPQSRVRYNEGQILRNPDWGEVGEREDSWGPVQIHLPDHPEVTREQAVDPHFSTEFLAVAIKNGQQGKWTCK